MAIAMTWPQYLRHECTVAGFTVKLSNSEGEALLLLMLRCPNPVTRQELIDWLWPEPAWEPEFTDNMVYHIMHRLRAKVGEFHIPSRVNFGYRLQQHPDPVRGRQRGKRGPSKI